MVENEKPKTKRNSKLSKGKTVYTSTINVNMPEMVRFARSLGMIEHKTYSLNLELDNLPHEQFMYFMRGVIDGDGSIQEPRYGNKELHVSNRTGRICVVTASLNFALLLGRKFKSNVFISTSKGMRKAVKETEGLGYIFKQQFSGNSAKALALLLPDESYMLKRKSDLIERLRQSKPKNTKYRWVETFDEAKALICETE